MFARLSSVDAENYARDRDSLAGATMCTSTPRPGRLPSICRSFFFQRGDGH